MSSSAVLTTAGAQTATALVDTQVTDASGSLQVVRRILPGSATTYGLDVRGSLLPWLGRGTFDAANQTLVIPHDTTGTTSDRPDFVRITAAYSRTDAGQITTTFNWTLWAPEVSDIVLPALPAEVGNIAPTIGDTINIATAMLEIDTIQGYDDVRHDLNAALLTFASVQTTETTVRVSISPLLRGVTGPSALGGVDALLPGTGSAAP